MAGLGAGSSGESATRVFADGPVVQGVGPDTLYDQRLDAPVNGKERVWKRVWRTLTSVMQKRGGRGVETDEGPDFGPVIKGVRAGISGGSSGTVGEQR